jgi:hypothetical protein
MPRIPLLALLLASAAFVSAPALAGVTVEYGNPDRFTDAGDRSTDPVKVMKDLAQYMKQVGDRVVPAGTDVKIEVLDLDRAGRTRMDLPTEMRVLSGKADPPCMDLRYTVTRDGQVGAPQKERVCDPDYLTGGRTAENQNDPLVYEKRMMARWIEKRFGAGK